MKVSTPAATPISRPNLSPISDSATQQIGELTFPYAFQVHTGNTDLNFKIMGDAMPKSHFPQSVDMLWEHWNVAGDTVLESFSQTLDVHANGKGKIHKQLFTGFNFQANEHLTLSLTPHQGQIDTGSRVDLKLNYFGFKP